MTVQSKKGLSCSVSKKILHILHALSVQKGPVLNLFFFFQTNFCFIKRTTKLVKNCKDFVENEVFIVIEIATYDWLRRSAFTNGLIFSPFHLPMVFQSDKFFFFCSQYKYLDTIATRRVLFTTPGSGKTICLDLNRRRKSWSYNERSNAERTLI